MGDFIKMLLASCLGIVIGLVSIFFIGGLVFSTFASSMEKPTDLKPNSVIKLTLTDPIPELTNNVQTSPLEAGLDDADVLGLHDIVDAIERAKDDDRIKGIYLEPSLTFAAGFTTARSIRNALEDFKDSGKFVYAHSKFYTQGQYYLSSVADEIYANPMGYFEVNGFSAVRPFYKDMLDRIGVKMQIFYAGKFKSATEPFRRKEMSPESKEQLRASINDLYSVFLDDVSSSRKMDKAQLKKVVDQFLADSPENAKANGLIDDLVYREEVYEKMKEKMGLSEDDKLEMVSLKSFNASNKADRNYKIKERIAVVYAEGTIIDGKGNNGSVGDYLYVKDINRLAEDDRVDAMVLRVNSPGGSALSSENIWKALVNFKETGKPLVISMGDYAASGGYYIACLGDKIYAEPNTLTGSIGVFRVIPSLQKTFDKMGISYDSVKTGPFAAGLNFSFDMSPAEQRKMQANTEEAYQVFLQRVADGRSMKVDEVHKIAQGRVWTGMQALNNGLVDELGGLEDAIAEAAKLADLDEFRLVSYPKVKDPLQQLIEDLLNQGSQEARIEQSIKATFPQFAPHYQLLRDLNTSKGLQARSTVIIPFE